MEDKAIIEAQQKLFEADPDTRLLAVAADAALVHFRKVFEMLAGGRRAACEKGLAP